MDNCTSPNNERFDCAERDEHAEGETEATTGRSSWAESNRDLAEIIRAGREELKSQSLEISSCPVSILQRAKSNRSSNPHDEGPID